MKAIAGHIFKRFFVFVTIVAVLFYLLACLAAYVNPGKYWYIAVLGVNFIFFLALLIILFIGWSLARSRWAWLPLIAMILGAKQILAVLGLHPFTHFELKKKDDALRVLQWNVTRWDEMRKKRKKDVTYRLEMFDYIRKMDPDVLCFQEFFESKDTSVYASNVRYLTNQLGYRYHYFAVDMDWWYGNFEHGVAIFSRFPIVDSSRVRFGKTWWMDAEGKGESVISVTLNVRGKLINVFTTHLQSFHFNEYDYGNIAILKNPENNKGRVLEAGRGILYKFKNAYKERYKQADLVRQQLNKSNYPYIITGDFNDVPNSYTYNTIKGNMQDAFVKKGFGVGRTYVFISPTLRIDYVLAEDKFDVLQYRREFLPYSDHYPVMADLRLK